MDAEKMGEMLIRIDERNGRIETDIKELKEKQIGPIWSKIRKLERWQNIAFGGGIVAGAALWEKAKKIMGLS